MWVGHGIYFSSIYKIVDQKKMQAAGVRIFIIIDEKLAAWIFSSSLWADDALEILQSIMNYPSIDSLYFVAAWYYCSSVQGPIQFQP